MVLYCYVILQDHVIKVHMTLWVGTSHDEAPSCQLQQLQALVVKMFFLCHTLWQEHVIKGPCNFLVGCPSWQATILPNSVVIQSGSGDIMVLISHVISQNYITQEPCCVLVKVSRGKSPPCQIWKSKTLWWWRCNRFRLPRDLTRPRDQKFM